MHVALVGDRDADLADLAAREHGVGVVAGLRRQVEGDREAGLALGEVAAVELVRAAGVGVPGVGAHHPGPVALGQAVLARPCVQILGSSWALSRLTRWPNLVDTMHLGRDRVIGAWEVRKA